MNTDKRKPGRPMVVGADGKKVALKYNWFDAKQGVPAFQWPNLTNKDIAEKVFVEVNGVTYHPSPVAVFLKRQKMIADGKKVACKKAKFTRSKTLQAASEAKKKAAEKQAA